MATWIWWALAIALVIGFVVYVVGGLAGSASRLMEFPQAMRRRTIPRETNPVDATAKVLAEWGAAASYGSDDRREALYNLLAAYKALAAERDSYAQSYKESAEIREHLQAELARLTAPVMDSERAELMTDLGCLEHSHHGYGFGKGNIATRAKAMLEADARWKAEVVRRIEGLKQRHGPTRDHQVWNSALEDALAILASPADGGRS